MTDKKKPERRRVGQRQELVKQQKYAIRVFLGKDSSTGKRHYHNEVFHGNAGQAEGRIREILRRHEAGEPLKATADTFASFLDEWIESKRLSVAESSLTTYQRAVEKHIRPGLGKKLLTRITADDVQRLYAKLHSDGISRTYIHDIHVVLGMIFKLAVKRKKLMGSPMVGVEIPKEWAEAEEDEVERAMTPEQVGKFIEAAKGTRFEHLFILSFHVGCRPGELLALKWGDLDISSRTLRINQNIVWRKAGDWYLKRPKTKLSRRTLPLTEGLIEMLAAHRRQQLEARLRAGKLWESHDFIFCTPFGSPHSQFDLIFDCKQILKAAGLPKHFTPYVARHTMATLLMAGGTNPKVVSERLGHSNITTTLAAYTHVSPGMQAEVSEVMERLLRSKK